MQMISTILVLRRIFRSISYRWDNFWVPVWISLLGVNLDGKSKFVGCPEVSVCGGSLIMLGKDSLLISRNFSTALGVSHPIIFRTLTKHASIVIGSKVGISGGSFCAAKEISVGDDCLFGADVIVCDTDFHPLDPKHRCESEMALQTARAVHIGNNVFLGTRAIVLKGVTIGDNTVIGAGSVVSKSIPENVIAAGNPCAVIRRIGQRES